MVSGEKQDRQRTAGTSTGRKGHAEAARNQPCRRGLDPRAEQPGGGGWGWGRNVLLSQPQRTKTDGHNTPPTQNVSKRTQST